MGDHGRSSPGTALIVFGKGVMTVVGYQDRAGERYLELANEVLNALVPVDRSAEHVRAPVPPARAAEWSALLRRPASARDDHPVQARLARYTVVLEAAQDDGDSEPVVRLLHELYSSHPVRSHTEKMMLLHCERLVLSEIEHVLGLRHDTLRDELRSLHHVDLTK